MTAGDDGKTFLLGVGCQKGGTSWLHDYLSRSDHVDFGPLKEYHIFDTLDIKDERRRLKLEARFTDDDAGQKGSSRRAGRLKYDFRANPNSYYDFFVELLSRPNIMLTGDITPSYSGLPADRYGSIQENFASRGVPVKAIFLMRDPVERIWSWVRMKVRRKASKQRLVQATTDEEALLLKSYQLEDVRYRTNYYSTIDALERVFAPGDILYAFYEQLFTEEATQRICGFLGIPYIEPDFDKAVNASPKENDISADTARRVAQAYAEVYHFAANRFGDDLIRSIWPHAGHVQI